MAAGESTTTNLRRIAILVTSLDAVAARQLLLHMPTELAKQVRRAMASLGRIDPAEQQRILADFRRVAGQSTGAAVKLTPADGSSDSPTYSTLLAKPLASSPGQFKSESPNATSRSPDNGQPTHSNSNDTLAPLPNLTNKQSGWQTETTAGTSVDLTWKKLNTESLAHLLRGERAAVVAVVVSQLSPQLAVNLMDQLPPEQHRDILARLGRLGEIDEDAMLAIDEHLASKLRDYQHELTSTSESLLRMGGILSAAPLELRQKWISELTRDDAELAGRLGLQGMATTWESQSTSTTLVEVVRYGAGPDNQPPPNFNQDLLNAQENSEAVSVENPMSQSEEFSSSADEASPTILPFEREHDLTTNDRSLQAIEFEQLLDLPLQVLAHVLNSVDAESILLALAGASPSFMDRFLGMLNRHDSRDLQRRLRNIGPIHLRDIDEAQRRIIEFSCKLEHQQAPWRVYSATQARRTRALAA